MRTYLGAHERTELQRDHRFHGFFPVGRVGDPVEFGRRLEGHLQESLVGDEGHPDLVGGHGQTDVGDVKDPGRGALVHEGVVQDAALVQAVAADFRVEKLGLSDGEAEFLLNLH